jgi:hypothetical protein
MITRAQCSYVTCEELHNNVPKPPNIYYACCEIIWKFVTESSCTCPHVGTYICTYARTMSYTVHTYIRTYICKCICQYTRMCTHTLATHVHCTCMHSRIQGLSHTAHTIACVHSDSMQSDTYVYETQSTCTHVHTQHINLSLCMHTGTQYPCWSDGLCRAHTPYHCTQTTG